MLYENLSALRKRELRTARKTKKEFGEELSYVEHLLNVFLKTFSVVVALVEADREFTASEDASFRIAWKIFRTMCCALNSCLQGYYDVSLALLRITFENHLLMTYLSKNQDEAKLWFEGKVFTPIFLRKKAYFSGHSLYRDLSEFIHSSFKSTLSFTRIEKDEHRGALGEYDEVQSKDVFVLMIMTLLFTIIWLILIFPVDIGMNEEWRSYSMDGIIKTARYVRRETSKARREKKKEG